MKNRILIIFIFILTLLSADIFSQRVIVFNQNNDTTVVAAGRVKHEKNNFQWNFSMLMRGAAVFSYERYLCDYLTAEVSLGITYVDVWHNIFTEKGMFFNHDDYSTKYGVGPYAGVALKIFPKQVDDMEGFYIAPLYRFRNYYATSTTKYDEIFKQSLRTHETGFIFGWQGSIFWDIQWNAYIGLGYMNKKYDNLASDWDNALHREVYTLESVTKHLPIVFFGMSMGFVF